MELKKQKKHLKIELRKNNTNAGYFEQNFPLIKKFLKVKLFKMKNQSFNFTHDFLMVYFYGNGIFPDFANG